MIFEPPARFTLPDGRALAYDEIGDAGAPAVLYLHGCPDCRLSRPPVAAVEGVRVIAVDRPGYGQSDPDPAGDDVTQSDDLVALADALGIARFAVLGWSAGASGALALGAKHASRVTAVGVAAGQPPIDADEDVAEALGAGFAMRSASASEMSPAQYAESVAPLLVPQGASVELMMEAVTEGKNAAYLRDLSSVPRLHEQLASAAISAVERGLAGIERDMRALVTRWPFDLASIRAPVLLWYGSDDHLFGPPVGAWLADRIPGARLEVIDGASHLLALVHWKDLIGALAEQS